MSGVKMDPGLKNAGAYDEIKKWQRFHTRAIVLSIVATVLAFLLIYPLEVVVFEPAAGGGLAAAGVYFSDFARIFIGQIGPGLFFKHYYVGWVAEVFARNEAIPYSWMVFVGVALGGVFGTLTLNPHRKVPNIYGDARWATEKDVADMERRNLVGPNGKLAICGKFKGKLLRMHETLSLLLLAPPGTGKSVGFIVPCAVELDHASLFIHDSKPELHDMVSGHRARLGPVFQLKWSAVDKPNGDWIDEDQMRRFPPELLDRDEKGGFILNADGAYKTKPIYYPSWNPLSPGSMPAPGPNRDTYIERLANVLSPDQTNGDKFWTQSARAALIGMMHYVCLKVEAAADAKIGGSLKGIPEFWHGQEPSLPMLVDWIATARAENDDGSDDPMRGMLQGAIDEAKKLDVKYWDAYGERPLARAVIELNALMRHPDKTQGSIMATVDAALGPFKNLAGRQRLSRSSFGFADLRGVPSRTAVAREEAKRAEADKAGRPYAPKYEKSDFDPVTIIISVNQVDAKQFAPLTAMFVDTANAYLTTYGPGEYDEYQKRKLGPFDFGMLLDECPQLPKLDSVMKSGPAVGRSKRVFYFIVGQDFAQFREKYSHEEVESLKTNTAIKIILSQNNPNAAEEISKMVGQITHKKFSHGDGQAAKGNPFHFLFGGRKSTNESWEGTAFLKSQYIMSMPEGEHVVVVQNYTNRPIKCATPRFFAEKGIAPKVFNLRSFEGPRPAPPMPYDMMDQAAKMRVGAAAVQKAAVELKAAASEPRHVIVATPRDIQALTRDDQNNVAERGNLYAYAEVSIKPDDGYFEPPDPADIKVATDVREVAQFIGHHRVVVFDAATLEEEINAKLRAAKADPLPPDLAVFLSERAEAVGEMASPDVYDLGYRGGAVLDLPEDRSAVTPAFVVRWISEIMTFVLGVEEQKRLFSEEPKA